MLVEEYLLVCLMFALSYAALVALALAAPPPAEAADASAPPNAPVEAVFMRARMGSLGRQSYYRRV
jgi:hypothetical protein